MKLEMVVVELEGVLRSTEVEVISQLKKCAVCVKICVY